MAEERHHIQRKQSQLDFKRRISMVNITTATNPAVGPSPLDINETRISKGNIQYNEEGHENQRKLEGLPLLKNRVKALLMKKIISTWRRRASFLLVSS